MMPLREFLEFIAFVAAVGLVLWLMLSIGPM